MIDAGGGKAPPALNLRAVPHRGNNPHGRGDSNGAGDQCLPPVGKEFKDVPGIVVQALMLEGVVGLLFGEELNKAQERRAQAAARVGDEGHESKALVGVDLVVVTALRHLPGVHGLWEPSPPPIGVGGRPFTRGCQCHITHETVVCRAGLTWRSGIWGLV